MNKLSKTVYQMMNYYFNGNEVMITDYFQYGLKDMSGQNTLHIHTLKEAKQMFGPLTKYYQDRIFGKNLTGDDKRSKEKILSTNKQIYSYITKELNDDEDLVITNDNSDDINQVSIPTKLNLETTITDNLETYLFVHTTKNFQINWILHHKTISDSEFAKVVSMSTNQITSYRTSKAYIGNMTLDDALNIDHYYLLFIGRKLIQYNYLPNMQCMIDSKNDTPIDLVPF